MKAVLVKLAPAALGLALLAAPRPARADVPATVGEETGIAELRATLHTLKTTTPTRPALAETKARLRVRWVMALPEVDLNQYIRTDLFPPVTLEGTQSLEPLAPGGEVVECATIQPSLARVAAITSEVTTLAQRLEAILDDAIDGEPLAITELESISLRLEELSAEVERLDVGRFYVQDRKVVFTFTTASHPGPDVGLIDLDVAVERFDFAAERWDPYATAQPLRTMVPSFVEMTDFRRTKLGMPTTRIAVAMTPATYCTSDGKPLRVILKAEERAARGPKTKAATGPTPLPQSDYWSKTLFVLKGDASAWGAPRPPIVLPPPKRLPKPTPF
jgi:hypothetical protein